jgi:DNA-binding XRE family transcriptional regulator
MNKRKLTLEEKIKKYTVPAEKVFDDLNFTEEEKNIIEAKKREYYLLVALKKRRKELKLTQAELAKKANLPRTTITKIESGTYNPTVSTLMAIASAMDKKLEVKFV